MNPSKKTVVLGYDAVSPLGNGVEEQWLSASAGKNCVGPLTRFPLTKDFPVRIAGQASDIDQTRYPFLSAREMAHWTSPIFPAALLVVYRAIERSGVKITPDISSRAGVTFSSAVGGLDAVLKADRKMIAEDKLPHPFTNPNSCINMVGGKVSILTGATGPITATITACATGCTSMIIGSMMIAQGIADLVICGAVDYCLVEPIVAGFAAMNGAYKHKDGDNSERASRPFSNDRRGFVIAEGAGAIIISSEEFARAHGLSYSIGLAGWSMTSDAHHFVAPNHDTVRRCITESIESAGISPSNIDLVNAHGTSTKIGDRIEYDALSDVFGSGMPPVSANKSLFGHAMGASSAIESILAMEGMLNSTALPTINYIPDSDIPIDCVPERARALEQEFVLKNSFGFGGCNSCIVFQRLN
jgi:3-oxoacyl-[acyl-carrier-protein] synthase II